MKTTLSNKEIIHILSQTLAELPEDWLRLTTHRLDIYNESLAKSEFLEKFELLVEKKKDQLQALPTAYDYIRLGHPLSSLLEWALAKENSLESVNAISFSSQTMPLLAILRANKFLNKKTRLYYYDQLPPHFNNILLKEVYQYDLEVIEVQKGNPLQKFEGTNILVGDAPQDNCDFLLSLYPKLGSVVLLLNEDETYVKEIQHVRRRESIAMTPHNSLIALKRLIGLSKVEEQKKETSPEKLKKTIQEITRSPNDVALGSCGLSVQYAIMMGLVHFAKDHHPQKNIKFIVPPNCYGGTNDQARRVAACLPHVEILDLPVDSGKDMVTELERILSDTASEDAVSYVIAEIPTNPRVEIPKLKKLRETLKKERKTSAGKAAVKPVFILDQTFCPNVHFFGEGGYLHDATVISYVSGSKFPSGGLCTAGYAVVNEFAGPYMSYVQRHLKLCDNTATNLQVEILTQEMPSMNERIAKAYQNTRAFVNFIQKQLPDAKINFVSEELAQASFTPSVFSLDLPTKGDTPEKREEYKRNLNHQLISMMIQALPDQSKHCVSYGQLKGCYWTIPATSTQGTTKESDKDYIVRVSVAADFDLEGHQLVFKEFVNSYY